MRLRIISSLFFCLALSAQTSFAKTWIIEGGALAGGRTISGSFDFDASTATYSNIDIFLSNSLLSNYNDSNPDVFVAGTTGGSGGPIDASHLSIIATGPTAGFGTYQLFLSFESELTNDATTSINLIPGTGDFLGVPGFANVGSYEVAEFLGIDNIIAGQVTPVPIGNVVVLFACLLCATLRTKRLPGK